MTRGTLALTAIGTTLLYLGLAVLGWGGFAAFFSHPALIALTIVLFALSGAALFTRGNLSSGEREDRGNRWVFIAFGILGLVAGYLPAYTDRKEFWTIDGDTIRWLGVLLFAARRSSAALAGLCARPSVQRAGRDPARTQAGHPPPQLFGAARQRAGLGIGISIGGRRPPHRPHASAPPRPHPRRREDAAHPVRPRIRCLLQPHRAPASRDLLIRTSAKDLASSRRRFKHARGCRCACHPTPAVGFVRATGL